jgi:hypothetical protein
MRRVAVETGVARGVTSRIVLEGLETAMTTGNEPTKSITASAGVGLHQTVDH